jgi:4-hydroxy-tetrahydrodipicolinate synthase
MSAREPLRGVYAILTTPFLPDGALDETSLRRVVAATVAAGVDGVTALGVAGEAGKLSDDERRRVLAIVMETVAGRLPVVVGTSRDGTDATLAACQEALAAGAAACMIAPPIFALPGAGLIAHYRRIAEGMPLPIVLQDFPPANGVTLTPAALAELVNAVPGITTVKLEDPPTAQRIGQLLALLDTEQTSVIGGAGGLYLLHELRAGAAGTMTGFAYPEALVAICTAWQAGDAEVAAETYYRYLPLLLFEGQPKVGLAIRKEILRRRGLLTHATVRQPGPLLDEQSAADLTGVLDMLMDGERSV